MEISRVTDEQCEAADIYHTDCHSCSLGSVPQLGQPLEPGLGVDFLHIHLGQEEDQEEFSRLQIQTSQCTIYV